MNRGQIDELLEKLGKGKTPTEKEYNEAYSLIQDYSDQRLREFVEKAKKRSRQAHIGNQPDHQPCGKCLQDLLSKELGEKE